MAFGLVLNSAFAWLGGSAPSFGCFGKMILACWVFEMFPITEGGLCEAFIWDRII